MSVGDLIATGPRYFCAQSALVPGGALIFGVPFDGTVSFRPGTRFGPDALRAVSEGLESYSPALDLDMEDFAFADVGNLELPTSATKVVACVEAFVAGVLAHQVKPLMLGGEHSITPGAVRALLRRYPDLAVLQFDAHADLRDGYLDDPYSHASAMRRCLDVLPPERLLQVGIRSGTREEFAEMRAGRRWVAPEAAALREALARLGEAPLYVTVDLDIFDPASLPGTGTPEPGGVDWQTFAKLIAELAGRSLVGVDVVELSPMLDATGCSAVLAAKVVRELLLLMASSA